MAPFNWLKWRGRTAADQGTDPSTSPVAIGRCDQPRKRQAALKACAGAAFKKSGTKLNELYEQIESCLRDDAEAKHSELGQISTLAISSGIGRNDSNHRIQRDFVEVLFSRFAA